MSAGVDKFDCIEPAQRPDEMGRLGPYRVLSTLGRGGMGQVFRAEDTTLERIVALKVMRKRYATSATSRARFIAEARSMAAVKHDNVVTVYAVGEYTGTPFLAMELLKGHTFETIIQPKQRVSFDKVFEYAIQITRGLAAAHARGIIHRDIKPANIWIEEPGDRVKILDFGLALAGGPTDALSGHGNVVGTPGYLSPEQAQGDPVDERTDLYSLGVVLYELCCGRLPFPAKTVPEQLIKIIAHVPERPDSIVSDLPRPYADLIMRLLAKDPHDRVRSAVALEELLESTKKMVQDNSRAAMQIVTAVTPASAAKPKATKKTVDTKKIVDAKKIIDTKPPNRMIWMTVTAISVTVLLSAGIWFWLRPNITASKPVSTTPKRVASTVVTSASLKPLVLKSATAESPSVPIGQYAKFKVQLVNTATNGRFDPRMVNRQAKVVAQIKTFLKPDGGERRNAPVFPKKFSISQIPDLGQARDIEIPFSTEGMPPGEYEVTFELQSPDGKMIGDASTRITVVENSDSKSVSEPESAASGGPIGSN
jgi:eukaryotic-like serine/threonine-protein kinase